MGLFLDRVEQTTNSTGTGDITLLAPSTTFQSFTVFGDGASAAYAIVHPTLNEWEVGIGTVHTAGPTLSRTTVLASTNSGGLVNFDAGNKLVANVLPSAFANTVSVFRNGSGVPSSSLGKDGDYYIDTSTGNVYCRASGAYTLTLNIKGPTGATGPANSLSIGTVATGTAAATITGTAPTQTLNLTLPPGPANSLSIGTVTSGSTPSATITGTAPTQTLNLNLQTGPTGATGPANSLSIGTVTNGSAAATITGTAPTQTLNLTLPTGATGAAGANCFTTTSANWTQPAVASTATLQVASTAWMIPGSEIFVSDGTNSTYLQVVSITDSTHAVCKNDGTTANAVASTVINSGASVGAAGKQGPSGALVPFPSAPAGLAVAPNYSTNTNYLTWTALSGASTYNVYRSNTSLSGPWTFLANVSSPAYADAAPVAGMNQYYCVTALSAGSAIGPYGTPTFCGFQALSDTFTATNGTNLTSHTPDIIYGSGTWTNGYGTAQISSNTVIANTTASATWGGGTNLSSQYIDVAKSDFTFTATFGFTSTLTKNPGLLFRQVDKDNFYTVTFGPSTISLYRVVSGSATLIQSLTATVTTGMSISIVAVGTSLSITAGGVTITATDSTFTTATKVGFFLYALNGMNFDNFLVV